jgi:hypothetical protein
MGKRPKFVLLASSLFLISLPLLQGQAMPKPSTQQQPGPPASTNATTIPDTEVQVPTEPTPALGPEGQAPDEMTKKVTDMVHGGKYIEAQKLTEGLLIAYPNDERLIKAKALIHELIASSGSVAPTTDSSSQPEAPALNSEAAPLTGMDKVDYDALILLGRKAQQTTELSEQNKLMGQFMSQSTAFLQKHPEQMLLWQLRAAIAMVANLPVAGYEAGKKLLDAGVGDSTDPNSLRLLAELKNKGFLDDQIMDKVQRERKQNAELARFGWLLGSWDVSWSTTQHMFLVSLHVTYEEEFGKSDSGIEGYSTNKYSGKGAKPDLRVTVLDSGEIGFESAHASGWQPVVSSEIDNDHRAMKIVASYQYEGHTYTATEIFTRK